MAARPTRRTVLAVVLSAVATQPAASAIRLKVLVKHELRCEGAIHNKALLAEISQTWGA